jgi:uncharacterized phosphosugar-binding protein
MLALDYYKRICEGIEKIKKNQMDFISKTAGEIAVRLEKGGILYVFGTGHSHVLAEEIYMCAGELIQAKAIIPGTRSEKTLRALRFAILYWTPAGWWETPW